jgi:Calcineurin-like phosphoesterase
MHISKQMKWRVFGGALLGVSLFAALHAAQQTQQDTDSKTSVAELTQVLGRPTDHSIAVNVLDPKDVEAYVEFGTVEGKYSGKTAAQKSKAKTPFEITIDKLKANTRYFYRLRYKEAGVKSYAMGKEYTFMTQRPPGTTFTFDVQSDSHPERLVRMFDPELYARTMASVRKDRPDFYVTMGDDFSVDEMKIERNAVSVAQIYIDQRKYLGMDGSSTPIFLVNGNHEQAAKYLLDGTPNNNAVWAGVARNRYYPNPAPDGFYTGDAEPPVQFIGQLRDYYAFTWGDALFVGIDPYWHSDVIVDNPLGEGPGSGKKERPRTRNMWDITHGEAQYKWLKKTLSESKAKYKFMFAHHVLGTGRGGTDMADLFEWGGKNMQGEWEFDKKRPGWDMPIHQLMVKYGVSIFFQGHDHLFVRQQKDGVVYQETPTPGDPNYANPNDNAYKGGDHFNAAGHLRVTVSPENTKVEYVRSWLPKDENAERKQDQVAFSYTVAPGKQNQ